MVHPVKKLYLCSLKSLIGPVQYAFAYGSAAFIQQGKAKGKMLDMVLVVEDSLSWHQQNLGRNRGHYSFLKVGGAGGICKVQELSAGVYYNTLVQVDDQLIKYGVISRKSFLEDLLSWKWLYISGRLHKPVVELDSCLCPDIEHALQFNRRAAALCGLLLTSHESCTEEDYYYLITGLSYRGDFRMYFGEDKNKVRNIVAPHVDKFRELYLPYLDGLATIKDGMIQKKMDNTSLLKDYGDCLPACVKDDLSQGGTLEKVLSAIVWRSSIKQSCKGIFTAGLAKTVRYSSDKIMKMIKSGPSRKS